MTSIKHALISGITLVSIFLLVSCGKEQSPNIVFILVDDLGWTDLGYSGSTFYETPNIDDLSHHSVQFTNAYSTGSVCSPSRASIMTGKHPARVNITDWIPGNNPNNRILKGPEDLNELPLDENTLAEILQNNGYRTFFAGKWHLGDKGFFPEDQGFDENYGGHHKGSPPGGYYSPYKNPKLSDGPEGEYLTDRLTNESISFLDRTHDEPFLLYLSYYTVHTPIQAAKKHIDYFNEKLDKLESKELVTKIDGHGRTRMNQVNPAYASMVYAMDENVGRLITALKERDLYDNTILVFTSDNGGLSTLDSAYNRPGPTSVRPLRGGKGWLYEGGIRVPLLIKPRDYNSSEITEVPVTGSDLFPTLLSLAGVKDIPQNDGDKLDPILSGNTHQFESSKLPERSLIWHYPHYHGSGWTPGAAIRKGEWKLITFYESNEVELYRLSDDISEENNLASDYPEKAEELMGILKERQTELGAQFPVPAN